MASKVDFIASYWTIAGKANLVGGLDVDGSSIPLAERAAAARRVGYCGMGLQHTDLVKTVKRYGHAGIKSILADNGMKYFEVEFLVDWFASGERRRASDVVRRDLLETAEKVGTRHIKVGGDMEGKAWPMDLLIESFAALCDEAANAGTTVAIEILPWTNIADVETGLKIVTGAGKANGSLVLDIWHMYRGHIDYESLKTIPPRYIGYIELNDADAEPIGTLLEDTVHRRKLCGRGVFDVPRFLRCIKATGYDGPFGIEIISVEQRARPLDEACQISYSTAMDQFAGIYP